MPLLRTLLNSVVQALELELVVFTHSANMFAMALICHHSGVAVLPSETVPIVAVAVACVVAPPPEKVTVGAVLYPEPLVRLTFVTPPNVPTAVAIMLELLLVMVMTGALV